MNILVLSPANAARSILLETVLNDLGAGRVSARSAGLTPAGAIHPQALKLLEEEDLDTARARTKPLEDVAEAGEVDILITLDTGPAPLKAAVPGTPARGHWSLPDPAALPEDAWEDGFRAAYDWLKARAERLLDHPVETMDTGEITALLRRIGRA
jgi:protein-tyrosine-phosphatase